MKVYYSVVSALIASVPLVMIIYLFRMSRLGTEPGRRYCWKDKTSQEEEQEDRAEIWDDLEEELKQCGLETSEEVKESQGRILSDRAWHVYCHTVITCSRIALWMCSKSNEPFWFTISNINHGLNLILTALTSLLGQIKKRLGDGEQRVYGCV